MRAILLILLTCLLTSCLSATREREANCLAATIMDVWQTEHELTSAEQVWRRAQQTRSERTAQSRGSSGLSVRVADAPSIIGETAARFESFGFPASRSLEDARLYQRMVVGFIEKALIAQVTPESRPHHIRIALCSNRSDKTPYIAAVPLTKLMVDRMPVRLEPKTEGGPVVLEMDLQGTANRKSVPGIQ